MTGRWRKVTREVLPGITDITYEYRDADGTLVGSAYRSGSRFWPWAWSYKGTDGAVGTSETLSTAKWNVEHLAAEAVR